MGFTIAQRNTWLDQIGLMYISAHTDDPGETGANEVVGAGYTRVGANFDAAALGQRQMSSDVDLSIPAGTTVRHIGVWSLVSGGTFYGSVNSADISFPLAGSIRVNSANSFLEIK